MTQNDNGLADRIRDRLAAKKTNPHRAAKAAGVSVDFVRDILRGRTREPGATQLYKLAEVLGTSVGHLLGLEMAAEAGPAHDVRPGYAALLRRFDERQARHQELFDEWAPQRNWCGAGEYTAEKRQRWSELATLTRRVRRAWILLVAANDTLIRTRATTLAEATEKLRRVGRPGGGLNSGVPSVLADLDALLAHAPVTIEMELAA